MKLFWRLVLCIGIALLWGQPALAQTDAAIVHAVLFYSPSCGHCHYVITEVLPPLTTKYGNQLQIIGVDVSTDGGNQLFMATLGYFGLERAGVPFLVIGDMYLIGSVDIPGKLPGLIEQHVANGGVGWPPLPGLAEAMALAAETPAATTEPASAAEVTVQPVSTLTPTPVFQIAEQDMATKFERDLTGNTLALVVLGGMVASLILAAVYFKRVPARPWVGKWVWAIPAICLIGFGVAGYLAYVETTQVEAVCGPVGDCNTVQQSEYARLFGILPIGVMGLIGYVLIFLAWLVEQQYQKRWGDYARLALFGMSVFGLLFSVYLTFLEPFVIGASCAWCLTSAILMTILFWLALPGGKMALKKLMLQK